jgi:hypothetical protein
MPTKTNRPGQGGGGGNGIVERPRNPFNLERQPSRRNPVHLRLVAPASVPKSPALAAFLGENPGAIAPIALLGRRLERCEIAPAHAVIALIAIVELFREEAP